MAIGLVFCIGCNSSDTATIPTPLTDSTEKAKAYFPILDILKSEIRYVDSLPVGILKYTIVNGVSDSSYIKPEQFHALATEFLSPVLGKESFEKEFKETSFFDNTTQYSSFLYSAINDSTAVRRIDVLAKPEDVVYNKIKSIYMEKSYEIGDSSVVKKMYWKTGKNFQINTEIRTNKPDVYTSMVKVVWDPSE